MGRIIIDKNSQLIIGDNIEFKRNVEIRVHKNSKIIILDFHSFDNYFYRKFMKKEGVKSIQDIEEIIKNYFQLEEVNTYNSPYLLWKYSISIYSKKEL